MKKWIVIPALAGAVVLGGVTMAANASNTEKNEVPALQDNLTIEQVESKAVETVGGKVTKVEFESEKSGDIYEVEVISDGVEYDLDIDAKTGEVLRTEKDDDDDDSYDTNEKVRASDEKLLTTDEVVAIALKKAKGTVTDVELDDDDGRMQYDIEIEDGTYEYDFEIDAVTGEILDFEKERDND